MMHFGIAQLALAFCWTDVLLAQHPPSLWCSSDSSDSSDTVGVLLAGATLSTLRSLKHDIQTVASCPYACETVTLPAKSENICPERVGNVS